MTYRTLTVIAVVAAFLAANVATALAATQVDAGEGALIDALSPVYQAFASGDYWYAGSLVLVVAAATARRFLGDYVAFLRTEAGTWVLLFAGSFGATLSARLAGPGEMSWSLAWDATKIALCASGGYAAFKALVVVPVMRPLVERFPRLASPLKLLTAMFDTGGSPPKATVVSDATRSDR